MGQNCATPEATKALKARFEDGNGIRGQAAKGHYRKAADCWLSSIGLGTYLGNWDDATDSAYIDAIIEYFESGGNVIDTASNYRFQRSERSIGKALSKVQESAPREELFIASKAGFLPFDGEPVADVEAYFEEAFVKPGIAQPSDLVGGSHCIAPGYIESQVNQSLANMSVSCVDLYYLHNPETQLQEVDRYTFEARIAKAFESLEKCREEGKVKHYGIASWNGFRVMPDDDSYHSLERFVNIARQVGGEGHSFTFVQLPLNLAMPEAYIVPNQAIAGRAVSAIEAARDLGISVMISAPLLQGRLTMNVPMHIRETLGGQTTDAMTSIQFARSAPGVTSALVGMSSKAHVAENMALAAESAADPADFRSLFGKAEGG